jgi:hypothetical protein
MYCIFNLEAKTECENIGKHFHSVLGLLHHVDMGDVVDVPGVHAASIFRVNVCRLMSFHCVCVYK